jgi:dolichol-phosphate mannosyltransferase
LKENQIKNVKQNEPEISLLMPVHNEAETIEKTILEFYREIGTKIPIEIIVAEDGSTDGTKDILCRLSEKIPMKLILGAKRRGYMGGVKDGLRHVTTDYVFFVDSDGQHSASDFWKLYEMKDFHDMIIGKKIKRNDPPHRILLSKIFHLMIYYMFRLPIHDPDTAYRLLKRELVNSVTEDVSLLPYSFWTEFTVRAFKKGFDIVEVPVVHKRRLNGDTRLYKLNKLSWIVISQLIGLSKLRKELKGRDE